MRRYPQRRRTRSAGQRSRVRKETISRSWRRWPRGSNRASAAMIARSVQDSLGDLDWRWRTRGLVAQDEDLGVLGAVGAGGQGKPAEYAEHRQVGQS